MDIPKFHGSGKAVIEFDDSKLTLQRIKSAIKNNGYEVL